jgi:CRP/FNR family transcriptional regulator, cyclic AMP receptor protein
MAYSFDRPELPALGWLTSLKKDDREVFGTYGEFLPAQPQQAIITEGQPQPYLYFIISGVFHIWKLKDNEQSLLASLRAGDSLGEMGIFELAPASATVVPEDFGQIWRINYEEFMRFVEDNPGAAVKILLALLTTLAKRLRAR